MGKYGYFTEDGKEFVITRPDTPQPWLNYSINGRYHALITNTGGGYSYYISPLNGRITRRRYNSLPDDRPGRYLYIRDNKTAEYYSPTWQPTLTDLEDYECRHGRGYSKISSQYKGLKHDVTIFVPKGEGKDSNWADFADTDVEIWRYTIENIGGDRELSLFPYVEFVPGDAKDDLIEQPNNAHFKTAHFNKKANAIIAENKIGISYLPEDEEYKDDGCWGKVAYMSVAGLDIHGYDTYREKFMGSVYRDESNPKTIIDGQLTNSDCISGHFCGALQSNITLKAGEKIEFCVVVGVANRLDEAYETQVPQAMKKWSNMANVDKAFAEVESYYDELYSKVTVETPEPKMNRHVNVWNKIQLETTFRCGRDASRYHLGLSYGVGYRDAAQDLLGFVMFEPEGSKDLIKELFAHMFNNGYVYHHYFRAQQDGHVFTNHSDDPLWMAISLCYYLRETADYSILDEVVPYRQPNEVPTKKDKNGVLRNINDWMSSAVPNWEKQRSEKAEEGTVLEHLFVGMDKVWDCRSDRDLPLMLGGDWNDDLNECGIDGKGESMMVAQQLGVAIQYVIEMAEHAPAGSLITKYADKIEEYKEVYKKLKTALDTHCWDGKWYHRFTRDNGKVEGTSKNEQGAIYLNTQTWGVIGGLVDEDKAVSALDSTLKDWDEGGLNCPWGLVLCGPEYTKSDATIGAATREAAGKKENASIFNHPVTWAIQANSMLGRGNIAYDLYYKTMPVNLSSDQDHFGVEPYVYPEYTTGPAHPTEGGRAGHSWLTGTAPWMFYSGVEFILGVRADYDGFVINPAIPSTWPGYKMTRHFQGAIYNITVNNSAGVESGVAKVTVDGKEVEGNKVPSFKDGKEHTVEVVLG